MYWVIAFNTCHHSTILDYLNEISKQLLSQTSISIVFFYYCFCVMSILLQLPLYDYFNKFLYNSV